MTDQPLGEDPCVAVFAPYGPRSGVQAVLAAADQATGATAAIAEIRALLNRPDGTPPRLLVSATTIRGILNRHGLT